jgi:hypothetical protein
MERQDIKIAVELLVRRVRLVRNGDSCSLAFEDLDRDGMLALGIVPEVADRLAGTAWWSDMLGDVAETPDFCEPDATDDEMLELARDVVREYVAKRL